MARERLQKLIARAGLASRREAERLIVAGRVAVNGKIVRELGAGAEPCEDLVTVDGEPLPRPQPIYLAIHKPAGVLCSLRDRFASRLIVDLLGPEIRDRVYPAGRLDLESEGLVILTNDGALTERITRPAGGVVKRYQVDVQGRPRRSDLLGLAVGAELDGQRLLPCAMSIGGRRGSGALLAGCTRLEVMLHEGKKNQIRRMFRSIGCPVRRLLRLAVGPVRLGDLAAGAYRQLQPRELSELRRQAGSHGLRNGGRGEGPGAELPLGRA